MDKHLSELDSRLALVQQQVNELLLKQRAVDETFYPPSRIRNEPFERPFEIVPLMVMLWAGTEANIPGGWALMDGSANSVGNGGSGIDLSGRFVVCVGNDGDSDHQDYAAGDTGGFQYHGGTLDANNHDDHDLVHHHNTNPSTAPTQCADGAGDDTIWAWSSDPSGGAGYCWGVTGATTWSGSGSKPDGSSVITHSQTDNRPPFYALCYIERLP